MRARPSCAQCPASRETIEHDVSSQTFVALCAHALDTPLPRDHIRATKGSPGRGLRGCQSAKSVTRNDSYDLIQFMLAEGW